MDGDDSVYFISGGFKFEGMNQSKFLTACRKKKKLLTMKLARIDETDLMRNTITRKIELLNCMIAEFSPRTDNRRKLNR